MNGDGPENQGCQRDAAEFVEASQCDDLAAKLDTTEQLVADLFAEAQREGRPFAQVLAAWHQKEITKAELEVRNAAYRQVAAALWSGKADANTMLAALGFVGGLQCMVDRTMGDVAKEIGCTKAALSKEANKWADKLHMRSKGMKSERARDVYHRRQAAVSKTLGRRSSH